MLGFLGSILGFVLNLIFRKPKGPSADERAGAAEAKLQINEASHEAVKAAVDARRAVERDSVRDVSSVRAPDKWSRD